MYPQDFLKTFEIKRVRLSFLLGRATALLWLSDCEGGVTVHAMMSLALGPSTSCRVERQPCPQKEHTNTLSPVPICSPPQRLAKHCVQEREKGLQPPPPPPTTTPPTPPIKNKQKYSSMQWYVFHTAQHWHSTQSVFNSQQTTSYCIELP